MTKIDWRELFAANQAQIRAALPATDWPALPALDWGAPARPGAGGPLVHVPPSLDPGRPAPLVCMLHGCTQDPTTFAAATRMNDLADRHGFIVVYPAQPRGRNPQGCWSWFLPEHQRRGAGEPAIIAGIVGELIDGDPRCTIDPERVFVAGLSSGGAMALILAMCYPDRFAGVAVHSGLPYRSADNVASAFQAMARGGGSAETLARAVRGAIGPHSRPVPSLVIYGTADRTVSPANATQLLQQSMTANHLAEPDGRRHELARPTSSWRSRSPGGHTYTSSRWTDDRGALVHELIEVDGLGHAWSGGAPGGSYTDPRGPSATETIAEFFSLTTVGASLRSASLGPVIRTP
jgi:poly(hydroxyalkanoate) depolymerase family esterase